MSTPGADTNLVEDPFKSRVMGQIADGPIFHPRLDLVEPLAQLGFLSTLTIVPWPTLKSHHHGVISDEMWGVPAVEQPEIGFIRPKRAQLLRAGDPGAGKGVIGGGAEISNAGNRVVHSPQISVKSRLEKGSDTGPVGENHICFFVLRREFRLVAFRWRGRVGFVHPALSCTFWVRGTDLGHAASSSPRITVSAQVKVNAEMRRKCGKHLFGIPLQRLVAAGQARLPEVIQGVEFKDGGEQLQTIA